MSLSVIVPVVKGQSGTATISGTVLCGAACSSAGLAYGEAINVGGSVYAQMSTQTDPNTGYALGMCPGAPYGQPAPSFSGCYNGQTSFGPGGQYSLQGLPSGWYNLYASAADFPEQVVAANVTVRTGQTVSMNIYLCANSGFVNGHCSVPQPTPEFHETAIVVAIVLTIGLFSVKIRKRKTDRCLSS